jgi:hypothetical protein
VLQEKAAGAYAPSLLEQAKTELSARAEPSLEWLQ